MGCALPCVLAGCSRPSDVHGLGAPLFFEREARRFSMAAVLELKERSQRCAAMREEIEQKAGFMPNDLAIKTKTCYGANS